MTDRSVLCMTAAAGVLGLTEQAAIMPLHCFNQPLEGETVKVIKEAGLSTPVVVGGAAVTREYAEEIGALGYARDATEAVEVFSRLIGDEN